MLAQAGGHAPLYPTQAEVVQSAPVRCSQLLELREEVGRLPVFAGLGEVVYKVMADAEQEAGLPNGVDETVRLLQGLEGRLHFSHFGE